MAKLIQMIYRQFGCEIAPHVDRRIGHMASYTVDQYRNIGGITEIRRHLLFMIIKDENRIDLEAMKGSDCGFVTINGQQGRIGSLLQLFID